MRVAVDPLAWVLALAGFFDGISDNWLHALLLLGAAVAVWWDAWLTATGRPAVDAPPLLTGEPLHGRRRARVLAVCAVAVAYAVVVGGFERYTLAADAWRCCCPGRSRSSSRGTDRVYDRAEPAPVSRFTVVGWSAVLVAAGVWELSALLLQPNLELGSPDHPTISFMMDTVLAGHLGRTVTLLAWLALGWWLLGLAPAHHRTESGADGAGRTSTASDPAREGGR